MKTHPNTLINFQAEYLKRCSQELKNNVDIHKIIREFLKDSIHFTFGDAIDAIYLRNQ